MHGRRTGEEAFKKGRTESCGTGRHGEWWSIVRERNATRGDLIFMGSIVTTAVNISTMTSCCCFPFGQSVVGSSVLLYVLISSLDMHSCANNSSLRPCIFWQRGLSVHRNNDTTHCWRTVSKEHQNTGYVVLHTYVVVHVEYNSDQTDR